MKPSEPTREGVLRSSKHCIQIPELRRPALTGQITGASSSFLIICTPLQIAVSRILQNPLGHVCFPAWTSSGKFGVPFSHPRSVNRRRAAAPPGRDSLAVGSWPGAPGPRRARLGAGRPTRPTPESPVPAGAGGSPSFPAPEGQAPCARIPGWHANPQRRPRGGLGTHALSRAVGGLSPAGSRPRGL